MAAVLNVEATVLAVQNATKNALLPSILTVQRSGEGKTSNVT
tara:strand:+ start:702 stop:827 length:126 start_codon:yes stop_codon:yes gene_type:complete